MNDLSRLTRKGACCHDLLSNLFELNESDLELFFVLQGKSPQTVDELSTSCNRHRSTVFRTLQKLESIGLIFREASTIKGGGYLHEYSVQDTGTIYAIVREKADVLIRSINSRVKEFSSDMSRRHSSTVMTQ